MITRKHNTGNAEQLIALQSQADVYSRRPYVRVVLFVGLRYQFTSSHSVYLLLQPSQPLDDII